MAPRNNDANTNYKKKNFSVDDAEVEVKNIVPCLLHKKHKVVKLVKSQIQKIQEDGLICDCGGSSDAEPCSSQENTSTSKRIKRQAGKRGSSRDRGSSTEREDLASESEDKGCFCMFFTLLFLLLIVFLLVLLIVWISSGPLSNTIAHTPIPGNSFVRTDSLCVLEKKYLLRWSKPEYYE